ncbi:cyclic nucleotide-binding domain-containing protein [Synechocystis sp. PCC 6714]|uniref:cyclic nucleotide-binding domain-containing protein n=1 Tax=Synechocystis sp. (strain PCC 6714) TaxID=1147 RepID=UPI000400F2A3|nr:cyclic nucleotide-binding domain-containing protein [Synechocystis sp. PCC 6714]AIE75262.1 cAMP protein kinase regulatory chain [Synechocystis sp. PCC 6714]
MLRTVENLALTAFLQGILGASSMALGALIAVAWQPGRKFLAAVMAFGSGTLMAAIALEIATAVHRSAGVFVLVGGFLLGGVLFISLSKYIDEHGGFLRKPAVSRRYVVEHKILESHELVDYLAHSEVMNALPEHERHQLAGLLTPHHAYPREVLCREGEQGDYFYLIAVGEADVYKGETWVNRLTSGDIFGEMSLLTGEPRSATVVAVTAMELYQLDKENFAQILGQSPHLALVLSRKLARRLQSATDFEQRSPPADSLSVLEPLVEGDNDRQVLAKLAQSSAPMAILVGTLFDNIPEAMVIGMNTHITPWGGAFLFAVFIANFPEALSSSFGMKQAGIANGRILALWFGAVVASGLIAMVGYSIGQSGTLLLVAVAQAIAGGGIIAMLASTMMPEAYELGGSSVAYATIIGFLVGFLISASHL